MTTFRTRELYLLGTSDRSLAEELLKFLTDSFGEHDFRLLTSVSMGFEVFVRELNAFPVLGGGEPASHATVLTAARAFVEGWRKATEG